MSAAGHVELYCPTCERSYHTGKLCEVDGTELVNLGGGADPLLGRALNDRYTIHERLGAGGMGTVYRGVQHSVGREVAIKVVSAGLVTDPAAIKRFLREAKLASRLSHPNAVSMLDFGQTPDGLFYLVMELLVGRTLDKVLRDEVRLSLPRVLRIASQVCEALDGAHRLNIIHRDLKPANVMLLDGDRDLIKVLDFGLAKSLSHDTTSMTMTASGAMLGTPAYMSPEAALGRELDARCDLYSLGCMLYVLASGRLPFHSESVHELVAMHAMAPPPPITGVPQPVGDVIMRLLAKEPADRYPSAAAAREALEAAAARASTLDALATTLPPNIATRAPTPAPIDVNAVTVHSGPVVARAPSSPSAVGVAAVPSVAEAPVKSRLPIVLGAVAVVGGLVAGFVVMKGGSGRTRKAGAETTTSPSPATPTPTSAPAPTPTPPSNAASASNTTPLDTTPASANTTPANTAPASANAAPANTAPKIGSSKPSSSKPGVSKTKPEKPTGTATVAQPAETKPAVTPTTTPPANTTPPTTTAPATTTPPKKATPW